MSTSSSAAARAQMNVEPFRYCEAAGVVNVAQAGRVSLSESEIEARELAARAAGGQEAAAGARAEFDQTLLQVRESLAQTLTEFAHTRADYYRRLESEVVQLALAIARRILHRESQVDPLLLAGVVRVALEKIESTTQVVLQVHPSRVSDFRTYFAQNMHTEEAPEVIDDASLDIHSCRLETAMGSSELGLEVQLKEIEKGLLDLMGTRPPERR
jgi:flagellar assembly protein FliH